MNKLNSCFDFPVLVQDSHWGVCEGKWSSQSNCRNCSTDPAFIFFFNKKFHLGGVWKKSVNFRHVLLVNSLCHVALHVGFLCQNFLFFGTPDFATCGAFLRLRGLQSTKSLNMLWFSFCFKLK